MIGAELRRARERAGLSRSQLAAATGMSAMGLWKLEEGASPNPRLASLTKLAKALGLTITVTAQGRVAVRKERR